MDGAPPEDGEAEGPHILSRGLRIPLDDRVVAGRVRRLIKSEAYEARECDAVLRLMRRGDVVLELGAGIGYMSALIAGRTPAARVVSYEANPALLPFIRRLHAANGIETATVHNALLSDGAGPPVPFYVRENFLASSMDRDSDPDTVTSEAAVPRHDIHAVLAELRPSVLVCDIEGAEASLLPAADLSCLRAAVVELHPQWIGQAGVQAVFDAFHRGGLTFFPKASHGKVAAFRKGW